MCVSRAPQANSTAFDTLSNASVNTEDGAGTYTNSEYTSHLVSGCKGNARRPGGWGLRLFVTALAGSC